MNGWLPETFEQTPGLADRIASGVKARNHRRKRLAREAWAGFGGAAVVAVVAVFVIPAAHITAGRAPGPKGNPSVPSSFASGTLERYPSPTVQTMRPASPGAGNGSFVGAALRGRPAPGTTTRAIESGRAQRPSPTTTKEPAPDLTLSRVDHSVEVAWQGNKNGEYVVYRCTSPKFTECSLADKVKGTKWVDSAPDANKLTFYRVEPKG